MTARGFAYRVLRTSNDLRAIKRGRVGKRIERRVLGRMAGRLIRSITK